MLAGVDRYRPAGSMQHDRCSVTIVRHAVMPEGGGTFVWLDRTALHSEPPAINPKNPEKSVLG